MADLDPETCEEEVMELIAELSCEELVNLSLELGLTGYDEFRDKKTKMRKFVMKYLVGLEDSDDDQGAAKFVQIYNYFKANPTSLAKTSVLESDTERYHFNQQLSEFTQLLASAVSRKGNEEESKLDDDVEETEEVKVDVQSKSKSIDIEPKT